MESTLLAYVIESEDDGGAVAFGRNPMEARRLGAAKLGLHYEDVSSCKRAPEMDSYAAAGEVPVQDMIEKFGWIYDCWECSSSVDGDTETYDNDTDEWKDQNPVYAGHMVFCSVNCHEKYNAERARREGIRTQLREGLLARYPGVTPKSIWELNSPPLIHFTFPGGQHEGWWHLGEENVLLCKPDLDAWNAYKASLKEGEVPNG